MALNNLFDMVKADRYTADGREAIIKAQEAETEDAKEKPEGAVSPDGKRIKQGGKWVPRKNAKQPGKTDKPNPNGVTAQQKQKLEAEKHEAARRDAQAPSKKTEVNTPGLRKDVQEAIKRSTPEEIKAYIKELRTPGSRMSRYFDNPDLLANVYEDELNKMTESKPAESTPSLSKEDKIRMLSNSKHRSFSSVPVSEWAETYSKLSDKELDEAYEDFLKFRNPDDYKAGGKFDYVGRTGDSAPRVLTGDTRIRVRKA